jgi:hypothetical protein
MLSGGAQNFKQGDTVALAQAGATLPGDFENQTLQKFAVKSPAGCSALKKSG